jgi:hypothetical protein
MLNFDKIQDRTFVLIFILFYVDIFYHKGEPILPHRHPRSLFDVPQYAFTGRIVAAKATLTRD